MSCLGEIDCLLSLVQAQEAMGEPMCKPEFILSGSPFLEVDGLRHPCLLDSGYFAFSALHCELMI